MDAEDLLKNISDTGPNDIIGFLDETAPQTTANIQKMLSFNKPMIWKNTFKLRANTLGFYTLNGTSVTYLKP